MDIEASLHAIAQRVHALLECASVTMVLGSPQVYAHPLLSLLIAHKTLDMEALPLELVGTQTLIARAMQERAIQCENTYGMPCCWDTTIRSVAVAPLERPAGLLGVLVCVDTQRDGFLCGERMLLEQAMSPIARELELLLCDATLAHVRQNSALTVVPDLSLPQTLVSLVGHDLRQPLTAIKGYAGLLQAYGTANTSVHTDIAPDLQRRYLEAIMEQTQHMEVLVDDLLDVSRLQHGQIALRPTWVDIISLCRRVVQVMQDKVEQQETGRYHIRYCPDAQAPLLWADPDRVQQVLTNLIENAIKYSPEGGLIEVSLHNYCMSSSITVRDWGVGIPHARQTALFRLFERGPQADQSVAGLGLGLYIARTLAEAMDGSITLSSSEEQGTSVSFTLPRTARTEATSLQNTPIEMPSPCEKLSGLL